MLVLTLIFGLRQPYNVGMIIDSTTLINHCVIQGEFTSLPYPVPFGCTVSRDKKIGAEYLRLYYPATMEPHHLCHKRCLTYHRYVLFESSNRPVKSVCHWCSYILPWKSNLFASPVHVIHADHLDENPRNNAPANLVPACPWCNSQRSIVSEHPDIWDHWLSKERDKYPIMRIDIRAWMNANGIKHKYSPE